jgi:hypothetical protein
MRRQSGQGNVSVHSRNAPTPDNSMCQILSPTRRWSAIKRQFLAISGLAAAGNRHFIVHSLGKTVLTLWQGLPWLASVFLNFLIGGLIFIVV